MFGDKETLIKEQNEKNPEVQPCMHEMIHFLSQLDKVQCLQHGHT